MGKLKLFLENFIVYGIGGVINKIIPIVMIPVVTRLMPDSSYYGISDMTNTIVSFGSALALMGMYDAMYRMFFEKNDEEYRMQICATTFFLAICSSVFIFFIMVGMNKFITEKFFGNNQYFYLIYIAAATTLVGATNNIVSAPTRMENKRRIYLIMNIVTSTLSYVITVFLLLKRYYIVALPVATLITGLSSEVVFLLLNKKWFNIRKINFSYIKSLLIIGVPLLPNFLIYWIFNSSDKLMITNLLGTSFTGVYSVGSKLGHISQLIYTAFAGGWQFFAFSTMKEKNQVENNSKIFEYLGVITFGCSLFMFALSYWIFRIVFTEEYILGYIIAPYLFLAPLLQMLFQVACNQFLIIKKTWPNFFILLGGAFINIILNLDLIPRIGIEGAAIGTVVGYAVSVVFACIILCKMKLMIVTTKFKATVLIFIFYILLWRLMFMSNMIISLIGALIINLIYIYMYKNELKILMTHTKKEKITVYKK